jgi:alanine dehydrogenase
VTLPYTVALADKGWQQAMREDHTLALGLNTYQGQLTNEPVAAAHSLPHTELSEVLA